LLSIATQLSLTENLNCDLVGSVNTMNKSDNYCDNMVFYYCVALSLSHEQPE
jgi:hypothetical protein